MIIATPTKEDRIGSLETGKYADFIVLGQNLLKIHVDAISEIQVLNSLVFLAVCQTPIVFSTNSATCSDEAGFCPVIKLPSCRV